MLTQERLKEVLNYEPETGVFTRKVPSVNNRVKAGDKAGTLDTNGYIHIMVDCKRYPAHRLAWFYVHGVWPTGDIDHINGVKSDNRIAELADTTTRGNCSNQRRHREGGLVGTYFHKDSGRWVAQMQVNGRMRFLGRYATSRDAAWAYQVELYGIENNLRTLSEERLCPT